MPTKPTHVRRYNAESKAAFREQLIQIARDLFSQRGYRGVSMRSIAGKAGCTPMALYAYFPNKLALLRFIWADIFEDVFEQTEAAMAAKKSAPDKLRAYSATWVNYWHKNPENYRTVFLNQDTNASDADPKREGLDGQFFVNSTQVTSHISKLAEVFCLGNVAGTLRKVSPQVGVQVLIAHLIGIAHQLVIIPEFSLATPEDVAIEAIEVSVRGFMHTA